ncbi:MAG: hypothetical protein JNM63_14240 [Spirochaetia bacterium]|nr:hypothetical protein [Spirochaetia bacterium]
MNPNSPTIPVFTNAVLDEALGKNGAPLTGWLWGEVRAEIIDYRIEKLSRR